ncbi:hypothetical protein TrLO_g5412 [Triparma laevis f. longispina]|uniref:Right handed beta helix domain-containing protein n=1 Tax=Triparma laevis f. longispina TaxID=1714387 RepID=A0A9W7KWC1_9STRA|nr:hypothetical protein TrLO_g5412 [Triparma laevis f. longispina]
MFTSLKHLYVFSVLRPLLLTLLILPPSISQTTCESGNPDVEIPSDKTWNTYTYSCRQAGGTCYSFESELFCDTSAGYTWSPTGYCGVSNLGVSCGCCLPPVTNTPTPAPIPSREPPNTIRTYYVDSENGNNSNDGLTIDTAWQTLKKAATNIQSQTEIVVMNGIYQNLNYGDGTIDNYAVFSIQDVDDIMLRAYPGHTPKVQFDGSGGISLKNVNRAEVIGFEVEGPNQLITREEASADRLLHSRKFSGRGIVLWAGSHVRFSNNIVHDTPNSGIRCNDADYVTVENNEVYHCTYWSSNAESAIVFAESLAIDELDNIKMIIRNNVVHDNENKIPYYNSNYDDPDYLEENQMHVARENYGSSAQTFIIDGSGVYISRNSASYLYGRYELSRNVAYRNGINGLVVHKTDRCLVKDNILYDNGQVSREEPASRQNYAGLTLNNAQDVSVYNNSVYVTYSGDKAFQKDSASTYFDADGVDVTAEGYVNYDCNGLIASDVGSDRVITLDPSTCMRTRSPTPAPTDSPTASPTATPVTPPPTRTCIAETGTNCRVGGIETACCNSDHTCFEKTSSYGSCRESCPENADWACYVPTTASPAIAPTPSSTPTCSPSPPVTSAPTAIAITEAPTASPTARQEMCEAQYSELALPSNRTWSYYTFGCKNNEGGECVSGEQFCDVTGGATYLTGGLCGVAALSVSCGCCVPPGATTETSSPTPAPTTAPTTIEITWQAGFSDPSARTVDAKIGDVLHFTWSSNHNVYEMDDEGSLSACTFAGHSTAIGETSGVSYTIASDAGPYSGNDCFAYSFSHRFGYSFAHEFFRYYITHYFPHKFSRYYIAHGFTHEFSRYFITHGFTHEFSSR